MIENLNGIHETVKYKENSNVKLYKCGSRRLSHSLAYSHGDYHAT